MGSHDAEATSLAKVSATTQSSQWLTRRWQRIGSEINKSPQNKTGESDCTKDWPILDCVAPRRSYVEALVEYVLDGESVPCNCCSTAF